MIKKKEWEYHTMKMGKLRLIGEMGKWLFLLVKDKFMMKKENVIAETIYENGEVKILEK